MPADSVAYPRQDPSRPLPVVWSIWRQKFVSMLTDGWKQELDALVQRLDRLKQSTKPKLFKLTLDTPDGLRLSDEQRIRISKFWQAQTAGTDLEGSKVFVLDSSMELTTVDGQAVLTEATEYLRSIGRDALAQQLEEQAEG